MECGDLILKNDGTVGMAYSEEDFATANYRNYQTVEEALETIAENYDYSL